MSTKVKSEKTDAKVRGSRRSGSSTINKVDSNNINLSGVNVSAPVGSGVGSGASGSGNSAPVVGVGSSSSSSIRAKRMDERSKLENSLRFEGFSLSFGVRDLSAKIGGFFSGRVWTGTAADTVRASLDNMLSSGIINEDQRDMMWKAAAKNAGVDLSAPVCSVGRVLAVVRREGLIPDFVSLVGMSFNNVRKHIKEYGLNDYTWRLGVGAIRSNSNINDFLTVSAVAPDSSASAVIGALLSLSVFSDYKKRVSAAVASDRSDYNQFISLAVRLGKRLGFDVDRVLYDVRYTFDTCSTSDNKERKQLRKNLASAVATINECNDLILSLGGVGMLDSAIVTSKVARSIKSALKNRAVAYSVCDTIEKLLSD